MKVYMVKFSGNLKNTNKENKQGELIMSKKATFMVVKRTNILVQAAVLAIASLVPALVLSNSTSAAQLTNRFVDLSSYNTSGGNTTEGSGRDGTDAFGQDVTYTVGFTTGTTANIGGIVIDFCAGSPITGDTCLKPTGFDTNQATLGLANVTGITGFTKSGSSTDQKVLLTNASPTSVNASTAVKFDLGTTAASDGLTNPTSNGSFYARIFTFTTAAGATSYTSTTPGAFTDDGGIAMAIANELTITARVQEVLQFCIGTIGGTAGQSTITNIPADSCAGVQGTNISLGVVDSSSTATSAANANGVAMIRTNASNGAVIYYKAEQDSTFGGKLKITGATCSGVLFSDQCFNSAGAARATIVDGVEMFGMSLRDLSTTSGGATTNLSCAAVYNGDGTACTGAPLQYAWVDTGAFTPIASSTSVLDDEKVRIEFAATASPTTPTGLYTVTANFVATATF